MDAADIARALRRLAHEIAERERGVANIVLLGIPKRGVPLCERIAANLRQMENVEIATGSLDIALYRDDYSTRAAAPQPTEIAFDIAGKTVVLVDDVLFTGRTIRAALDALNDFGRPARVQLAVLVDRGHRELPIQATFVGRTISTSKQEIIEVKLNEIDGQEQVLLVESAD